MKNIHEKDYIIEFTSAFTNKINLILIAVHSLLLFLFILGDMTIMIYFNMISLIYYFISLRYCKKYYFQFLTLTIIEVIVHSSLAIITVSWALGFQLYALTLCVTIYYFDYLRAKHNLRSFRPLLISIILCVWVILISLVQLIIPPIYTITNSHIIYMALGANTIVTFAFTIYFMSLYETMALKSEDMIRTIATTDHLTNLHNRSKMFLFFDETFKRKEPTASNSAISLIDIDDFKKINDNYSHSFGDQVLKQLGAILSELESSDIHVARWGGEEFLIFSTGTISFEAFKSKIEALILKVAQTKFIYHDIELSVTLTAGLAAIEEEDDIDQAIEKADTLLYVGKKQGKNQLVV